MNADEEARQELRKLLLDDVQLPPEAVRESMFERTFASEPGAGSELLPPDGLFDPAPDEPADADLGAGADRHREGAASDGVASDADHGEDHGTLEQGTDGWLDPLDPGVDSGGAAATDRHDAGADGVPPPGDPSSPW